MYRIVITNTFIKGCSSYLIIKKVKLEQIDTNFCPPNEQKVKTSDTEYW